MEQTDRQIRGHCFVNNGITKSAEEFDEKFLLSGISFYEVFRIKEKTPLFLGDHLDRLAASVKAGGGDNCPSPVSCESNIRLLINGNSKINEGNIRLILHYSSGLKEKPDIFCHFAFHFYPSAEDYISGISLVPLHIQRPEVHAKIINTAFRMAVTKKISDANAYEALLVNNEGYITEGSKSNIFFVAGDNKIVTPPAAEVLQGITRKYVLYSATVSGIDASEERIRYSDSGNYDACFLTGTSPGVLAVKNIGSHRYNVKHPLLGKVSRLYEDLVFNHIQANKINFNR